MHARPISSADPTRHSRSPVRVLGGSLLQGLLSQHQQKLENIWDNCFQTLNSSEQRFRIHKRRETIQVGLKTLQCTSWKQFPGHREKGWDQMESGGLTDCKWKRQTSERAQDKVSGLVSQSKREGEGEISPFYCASSLWNVHGHYEGQ